MRNVSLMKNVPGVVSIYFRLPGQDYHFLGSGFFVSSDYVVTARHLFIKTDYDGKLRLQAVDNPSIELDFQENDEDIVHVPLEHVYIKTNDGAFVRVSAKGSIIFDSSGVDVALLLIDGYKKSHFISLIHGTNADLRMIFRIGETVAIGYDRTDLGRPKHKLVKSRNYPLTDTISNDADIIEIDDSLPIGMSGGPVVVQIGRRWYCAGFGCQSATLGSKLLTSSRIIRAFQAKGIELKTTTSASLLKWHLYFRKIFLYIIAIIPISILAMVVGRSAYIKVIDWHSASSNTPLTDVSCKSDYKTESPFPKDAKLRILVLRFHGASGAASSDDAALGELLGFQILDELNNYVKAQAQSTEWSAAEFKLSDIVIKHENCTVANTDEAVRLGKSWNADVVIWGRARSARTDAQTNQGSFKTFITITKLNMLHLGVTKGEQIAPNVQLENLSLPELMSQEKMALLDFMLGAYWYYQGNYRLAVKYLRKSDTSLIPNNSDNWESRILLGRSSVGNGEIEHGMEILKNVKCYKNITCQIMKLLALGLSLSDQRNESEALEYFNSALALAKSTRDGAGCVEPIEELLILRKHHNQSITNSNTGIAKLIGSDDSTIMPGREDITSCALVQRARIEYQNEDLNKAKSDLQRALRTTRDGDFRTRVIIFQELSNIARIEDNLFDSRKYLLEALTAAQKGGLPLMENSMLIGLAAVCAQLGKQYHAESWHYLETALGQQIETRSLVAQHELAYHAAIAYHYLGQQVKATSYYRQAISIKRNDKNNQIYEDIENLLTALANCLVETGQFKEAISLYRQAAQNYAQRGVVSKAREATMVSWGVALQNHMWKECEEILLDGKQYGEENLILTAREARLRSYQGNIDAARSGFEALEMLASQLDDRQRGERWRLAAQAGLTRALIGGTLFSCFGKVVVEEQMSSRLIPGDIITRINGQCAELSRANTACSVLNLELWRDGKRLTIITKELPKMQVF